MPFCTTHGKVNAVDKRLAHQGVSNVLLKCCPECDEVLAIPHSSVGRLAYRYQQEGDALLEQVRISYEMEDLIFGIAVPTGLSKVKTVDFLIHTGLGKLRVNAFDDLDEQVGNLMFKPPETSVVVEVRDTMHQRVSGVATMMGLDIKDALLMLLCNGAVEVNNWAGFGLIKRG